MPEEPDQQQRADGHEQPDRGDAACGMTTVPAIDEVRAGGDPAVRRGLQDAEHHEEQAGGRQDRPDQVEASASAPCTPGRRCGGPEHDDQDDDRTCSTKAARQ